MLSPEHLEHLPEPLIKLWQQVEEDILRDIGRRIRKMDNLTDTAAYQAFRLEQTKLLRTDIVKLIAKYSGKSESAIRKMLTDAAVETLHSEDVIHAAAGVKLTPINESQNLLNLLNAGYRQTAGTWLNLTATTANTVTRQFEDALDRAWLQVSSGAFDYQTAIRRAVDGLAEHMDGVTYPSGHHDTLEVAVRRATLTGVNQTCGKLQWERREQAGCEFVEVTAHSGAREYAGGGPKNHAGWQGKVYHIGGAIWYEGVYYEDFETATGYGTGDGLCGWNCRHNFCAFWPGISSRVYTDEQLAELSAKNIEYNGKMYSRYEINQMQRAKERNVRKWKKTWMIEKEAGLDTAGSAIRLKNARKSLSDFAKATGGRVDSARLSTWNTSKLPGKRFGHSEATSANWDVRKNNKPADGRLEANNADLIFKLNSEYRTKDGEFDFSEAQKDYSSFLTSVPEKNRIYLEQSFEGVTYHRGNKGSSPFSYVGTDDTIYYDPDNPSFGSYIFCEANTHELAHRIDYFFGQSIDSNDFSSAIQSAKRIVMQSPEVFSDFCWSHPDDPFVSDIIDALSEGTLSLPAGHGAEYWTRESGGAAANKEIFANLFSMESLSKEDGVAFLKNSFPDLYNEYIKLL